MNNNRTNSFYKVNHRYNPRISDIIPDNTSNGLNLTRFYSFRQNNAQSRPQQQQQQQQLPLKSSSSSERVPINDVLDKWRQMNTLKKKPIHNSVVPAQGQKPTTVLDLDQIMENDLENQLKQMEIQPKPKITLVTIRFALYKIELLSSVFSRKYSRIRKLQWKTMLYKNILMRIHPIHIKVKNRS